MQVWRSSDTVVRADLIRPYNPKQARVEGIEDSHEGQQRGQRRRKRMRGIGWEPSDGYLGGMIQGLDRGLYGNGAQLKLMQVRPLVSTLVLTCLLACLLSCVGTH